MTTRYLLTSRDVGAAHQLKYIASALIANGQDVTVVSSGAATRVMQEFQLDPLVFNPIDGKCCIPNQASRRQIDRLLEETGALLQKVRPDRVICGLGTQDYGIDEAVIHWCCPERLDLPCYQYLDTWGTFNHLFDSHPDAYLVLDEWAIHYGWDKAKAPMHIVGSPKYYAYKDQPIMEWRKDVRDFYSAQGKMVGYFGQDPSVQGHWHNFFQFVQTLDSLQQQTEEEIKLLFCPHPGYIEHYQAYWDYLELVSFQIVERAPQWGVEQLLCGCDLVVTIYSTVAVDHAHLSAHAPSPIGSVLNLFCGPDIKDYLVTAFGYWKTPILDAGIGYLGDVEGDLPAKVKTLLGDKQATIDYWQASKRLSAKNPNELIMDLLNERNI